MTTQETQTVKFIRNACAEGQGYEVGDIQSFSPKTCGELIAARAVELFTKPEKSAPENASLPASKAKRTAKKAQNK